MNKKKSQSYKDRLPPEDETNLFATDVLKWITEEEREITEREIADHFGISINDANSRIDRLKKWGMARMVKRTRPRTYIVTNWGKKYLKDQKI